MNDTVSVTYNGWSNRETWLVSLWLNNDPASYDLLQAACKRAVIHSRSPSGLNLSCKMKCAT